MNIAYLLTGGNMGNREENLAIAEQEIIACCGTLIQSSSIYETAAWGKTDQPAFLNQVLMIHTPLTAQQLMHSILNIEEKLGRVRKEKYGPRIIDIDILLFNDEIINTPDLKIPHPQMQNRRFVLAPLAEIAGSIVHPVLQKTIDKLLRECPDELPVYKYP